MGKEKKEIWIEKLIELLNEYDSPNWWKETEEGIDNVWKIYEFHSELQIISKKYGFIKWLVENDKIDINKTPWHYIYHYTDEDVVKEALMQLAIQDEPIEFLCSLLK